MRIARLALQIRSLLTSGSSPQKPFLSRHFSSIPKWDCTPASNRSWHSKDIDAKDLEDPISFYQTNPIFDNILTNQLIGRPTSKKDKAKINQFRARICQMDQELLSEMAAFGIRSLAAGVAKHHVGGIHLGDAVKLSNLRICKSTGEWILMNILPKEPMESLTLKHRSEDWIATRKLVKDVVEAVCGSQIIYPVDFQHWLDQLAKPNPKIFLILYHTVFLRLNPRFYYHIQMDQFLRKEPNYIKNNLIDEIDLFELLRSIGDLRGLLSFAEMHELLKACMEHHDRAEPTAANGSKNQTGAAPPTATPTTASKRRGNKQKTNKTSKATNAACQGLSQPIQNQSQSSQNKTGAVPATITALKKGQKHCKGGKTATKRTNATNSAVKSQASISPGQSVNEALDQERLRGGRNLVAVHRNSPIHGCQQSFKSFEFTDRSMLNRQAIIQLLYFVCLPFDHTTLELFYKKNIHPALDMEGLFGETPATWRAAIKQQEEDDKLLQQATKSKI